MVEVDPERSFKSVIMDVFFMVQSEKAVIVRFSQTLAAFLYTL